MEYRDQFDWWGRNKETMVNRNLELGEMWWQRMGIPKEIAIEQFGLWEEYE